MASTFEMLVNAVHEKLGMSDLECGVSGKALSANSRPPRIVWVRVSGVMAPADTLTRADVELPGGIKGRYKVAYSQELVVQANIWAADNEHLERLHMRTLSACRDVFGTGSQPGSFEHIADSHSAHGVAMVQQFKWSLHVGRFKPNMRDEAGPMLPVEQLVTVTNTTHVCSIDYSL